jgi:hypothetical protein
MTMVSDLRLQHRYGGLFTARGVGCTARSKHSTGIMVSLRPHPLCELSITLIGPIIRVSPNELSFASITSWKAIYGQKTHGEPVCNSGVRGALTSMRQGKTLPMRSVLERLCLSSTNTLQVATKNEFYSMYGSAHKTGCIGSERDPQTHSRMKRSLTSAFSTRALTEQEPVINKCVDEFMDKIGSLKEARERGLDMTHWFEMVAFGSLVVRGHYS